MVVALAVIVATIVAGVVIATVVMGSRGTDSADDRPGIEVVSGRSSVTHSFVVPPGASARTAQGEDLGIVPQVLEVRVGDTIRIRNDDDVYARVGIFSVAPHSTVTMRFTTPGHLEGACDVHPSGRFAIEVAA